MKKSVSILLAVIILLTFTIAGFGQWISESRIYSNQYTFTDSNIYFGFTLPSGEVTDFDIDTSGNIWFATAEGLRISQKKNMVLGYQKYLSSLGAMITPQVADKLNSVYVVKKDEAGNMWLGTGNGLLCFDGIKMHEIPNSSSLPFKRINEIAIDRDGNIWVCGDDIIEKFLKKDEVIRENTGIARYDGQSWQCFTTVNSDMPCSRMHSLTFTADGAVWMLGDSNTGICRFKDNKWTTFTQENSAIPGNSFSAIAINPQTKELLFGWDGGILTYNGSAWTREDRFLGLEHVTSIYCADDHSIWIGTRDKGLYIANGGIIKNLHAQNSPLMNNRVTKLVHNSGYTWILQPDYPHRDESDVFGGICALRFDMKELPANLKFYHAYNAKYLTESKAMIHYMDRKSFIVAGREQLRLASENQSRILHDNRDKDKYFGSVISQQGEHLVVSKKMGLCRLNDGQLIPIIPNEKKTFNNDISQILIGSDGTIWMASEGDGILKCMGGKVTVLNKKNAKLPDNDVYTIFLDRNQRLWAGTDKGVCYLEGDAFVTYDKKNSALPHNEVHAICEDETGTIYLGTKKGLATLKDGLISIVSQYEKIWVNHLACDKNGSIWVGTPQNGLFRHSLQESYSYLQNSILDYTNVTELMMAPQKDHLWLILKGPKTQLPAFSSGVNLSKAEEKLSNYDEEKEMTEKEIKELNNLKRLITMLKKQARYEDDLLYGLRELVPDTVFVSIDFD